MPGDWEDRESRDSRVKRTGGASEQVFEMTVGSGQIRIRSRAQCYRPEAGYWVGHLDECQSFHHDGRKEKHKLVARFLEKPNVSQGGRAHSSHSPRSVPLPLLKIPAGSSASL